MRTFTKTSRRLNGKDRTATVRVEAVKGRVLVTSQDEASAASHLSRHPSDDPARTAREIGDGLVADGYTAA